MDQPAEFVATPSAVNPEVTVLRLTGFIDVNAAPEFERVLADLLAQGRPRILVDLAGVTYISSAGIGVFVGMLRTVREQPDGDIKIFRASPKILKVFESIGLTSMLDVLADESEVRVWHPAQALPEQVDHFAFAVSEGEIQCGREFQLRVEARDASQRIVEEYQGDPQLIVNSGLVLPRVLSGFQRGIWEGQVVLTDAGMLTLIAVDGQIESRFNLLVREESNRAVFPQTVRCRRCGHSATVKGMDIYRCARCDEIFYVDAWAHVITLKSGSLTKPAKARNKGMELKINGDVNYLNSIRRFITGLCEQEQLDEVTINEVILTAEEALLNIIEHSNHFDPDTRVILKLRFQERQLLVQIRDFGEPFDITSHRSQSIKTCIQKGMRGGVGGMLINQLMDRVTYRRFKRFNQLTLLKKYSPEVRRLRRGGGGPRAVSPGADGKA